jgi:peroxiredoxin
MIMKKISMMITILFVCSFVFIYPAHAGEPPPAVGEELPEIILSVPENPEHQKYLGLTGKSEFTIPQIAAEVVVIEIFSMYCPHCQREAPTMNEFYERIKNSDKLSQKVKLIGIGVGNSAFEVDHFRKTYKIPFPLFPDSDFSIHKKIGEVRTPYFIGVKIKKDGTHSIYYSKLGGAKRADQFLNMILDRSGLR